MTSSVIVLGTAVVDAIAYAERRPLAGETVVGDGYEIAAGGKGLNQAIAAARAGARAALVAAIGDDQFGHLLSDTLAREQVDTGGVLIRSDLSTGVGFPVVTRSGDNSIVVVPSASSAIAGDHHAWLRGHVDSNTVFLTQLELPIEVVEPATSLASGLGARVLLNPAPAAQISQNLASLADVIVPNRIEAEMLTGLADPVKAARALAGWKREMIVIVTCGAEGVVLIADGVDCRIEAPEVKAIDTVGAGDVFCGYLAAGLAKRLQPEEAARTAVRAASFSVTRRGAAVSAPVAAELSLWLAG